MSIGFCTQLALWQEKINTYLSNIKLMRDYLDLIFCKHYSLRLLLDWLLYELMCHKCVIFVSDDCYLEEVNHAGCIIRHHCDVLLIRGEMIIA